MVLYRMGLLDRLGSKHWTSLFLGAHFGTTYAHLLFQSYYELVPAPRPHIYQPRIFGFRVNEKSVVGPRMQWLRMRPRECTTGDDEDEDEFEDDVVDQEEEEEDIINVIATQDMNAVGKDQNCIQWSLYSHTAGSRPHRRRWNNVKMIDLHDWLIKLKVGVCVIPALTSSDGGCDSSHSFSLFTHIDHSTSFQALEATCILSFGALTFNLSLYLPLISSQHSIRLFSSAYKAICIFSFVCT